MVDELRVHILEEQFAFKVTQMCDTQQNEVSRGQHFPLKSKERRRSTWQTQETSQQSLWTKPDKTKPQIITGNTSAPSFSLCLVPVIFLGTS